jgi:hypothetical protein
MRLLGISALVLALGLSTAALAADKPAEAVKAAPAPLFEPDEVSSEGSVTVRGARIDYKAVAGTLVVHPKGWDDAAKPKADATGDEAPAEASMFYTAYFKKGAPAADRPLLSIHHPNSTRYCHGPFFQSRIPDPAPSRSETRPPVSTALRGSGDCHRLYHRRLYRL